MQADHAGLTGPDVEFGVLPRCRFATTCAAALALKNSAGEHAELSHSLGNAISPPKHYLLTPTPKGLCQVDQSLLALSGKGSGVHVVLDSIQSLDPEGARTSMFVCVCVCVFVMCS